MDPQLVEKRRSTIFQRIQLELTHSTVIRKRISPGKFPTSSVGIVKVISVVLLISAAITFLVQNSCPNTAVWYDWLLPIVTSCGAAVTIIFYSVFTLGLAIKYPDFWFISDITTCLILAVFIIITSVVTMVECSATASSYKIPGPLGIVGAVFLLFAGAGLYIMYRNKEVTVKEAPNKPKPKVDRSISTDVDV